MSWADRIAYVCHDFEDAVSAGVVPTDDLPRPRAGAVRDRRAARSCSASSAVVDGTLVDGRVAMTADMAEALAAFRACNYERIYLRPASLEQAVAVERLLGALVEHLSAAPDLLPAPSAEAAGWPSRGSEAVRATVTYVAGMTDRFASRAEHLLGWDTGTLVISAPRRPRTVIPWTCASGSPRRPRRSTSSCPTTSTRPPSSRRRKALGGRLRRAVADRPQGPPGRRPRRQGRLRRARQPGRGPPGRVRVTVLTLLAPVRRRPPATPAGRAPHRARPEAVAALDLLDRRLLFVTGKGGVGKTTVAAALALLAAQRGKRTLVCEVEPKGDLADFFESGPVRYDAARGQPDLFAMAMDTERSLDEYLRLVLRVPVMGRIGPVARMFDFVATAAPGVKEILTVGKLSYEVRERHYDLVVVDAVGDRPRRRPTGGPEAINSWCRSGSIRSQTDWMLDILSDPVRDGRRDRDDARGDAGERDDRPAARVRTETTVELAAVVVNRVLPELFGRGEEEVFERLRARAVRHRGQRRGRRRPRAAARRRAPGCDPPPHARRPPRPAPWRPRPALPLLYVPYLFARTHGLRSTREVAESLAAELGY